MEKLRQKWNRAHLNHKVAIIAVVSIMIPSIIFIPILFGSMLNNTLNNELNSLKYKIDHESKRILTNVESLQIVERFFLGDNDLEEFLILANERTITARESIDFYANTLTTLERMVNSNPLLYQVRLYLPHNNVQEMMPIIYHEERKNNMYWATQDGWNFSYVDNLFPSAVTKELLMAHVSKIYNEDTLIATMEVSMTMQNMFNSIYEPEDGEQTIFIDNRGIVHGVSDLEMVKTILSDIDERHKSKIYYKIYNANNYVIGYTPIEALNGSMIIFKDITKQMQLLINTGYVVLFIVATVIIAITAISNRIISKLFTKFYDILYSIHEIQRGDLSIVIEEDGDDEINELGIQINKLTHQIKELMEENISREILIKNSEIKALQNQINAHFIYNVLESIKMMAEIEEQYEISDAVTALGKLLRYTIKWTNSNVTIEEELEYIKNYMVLINLRFDYEVLLDIQIDETVLKQSIPKMSLQPIIENSLYHGIEDIAQDTTIYIKGVREGSQIYIEIMDTGKGMTPQELDRLAKRIDGAIETTGGSGNSIGLKNVQDRISMCFGDEYRIRIESQYGSYTKVRVYLPVTAYF
ncbi:MAG: hypothetical protein BEN18_08455 [Epulopiscium sp. Nuni2H_MBin001]|nr:MAG: hypothetical protein BEN18_08455 [Epulopiscium sp. Nuni2H_MBin001]